MRVPVLPRPRDEATDVEEAVAVAIARDLLSRHVAGQSEMLKASRIDSPPPAEWIREKLSDFGARSSAHAVAVETLLQLVRSTPVPPHWDFLFLVHDEDHRFGPTGVAVLAVDVDEESGEALLSNLRHDWFPLANGGPAAEGGERA